MAPGDSMMRSRMLSKSHVILASISVLLAVAFVCINQDMATLASQVVLHPYVSLSLKYGGNNVGRDKLYRTIQYFARFLAWYLSSRGDKAEAVRWNALKSHLALGRKLMRLGKPVEHLQAALRAAQSASHAAEQLTTIGRQLGYFGYLTYDAIVWANAIKFINLKPDTAAKVTKTSNRFWLAGILFSITHNILKLGRLAQEAKGLRATQTWGEKDLADEAQREVKVLANASMRSEVRHQFVIDLLDIWIPAFNLNLVGVSDGFVGIAGLISSIMGVRAQWIAVNGVKKN